MRFWTPFSPIPTPSTRSRSPVPPFSLLDRRKRAVDRFHRSHRRSDQRRQIPEPRSPRSLLYASLAPSIQTTTPRTCSKGCSTDWGADARRCCADWSLAECAWRPMAASTSARCCRRRRCRSCRNCLLQVVLEGESVRLIEKLADIIAERLFVRFELLREAEIEVVKKNVDVGYRFSRISVKIHRRREDYIKG